MMQLLSSFRRYRLLWLPLLLTMSAAAAPPEGTFASRERPYKLQPLDVIDVQFRLSPEYNQTVTLQPDGFITLQMGGSVRVGGLTVAEAVKAIAEAAGKRLRDPETAIILKDFQHPQFVLAGEVAKPGKYDLRGDITALEAVAIGGGFKESAKHSQVLLVRRFDKETAEVRLLDMKRLGTRSHVSEDFNLRDGDMLVVPQSLLSKAERFVRWGTLATWGISISTN